MQCLNYIIPTNPALIINGYLFVQCNLKNPKTPQFILVDFKLRSGERYMKVMMYRLTSSSCTARNNIILAHCSHASINNHYTITWRRQSNHVVLLNSFSILMKINEIHGNRKVLLCVSFVTTSATVIWIFLQQQAKEIRRTMVFYLNIIL